jgi:hypothetical protein
MKPVRMRSGCECRSPNHAALVTILHYSAGKWQGGAAFFRFQWFIERIVENSQQGFRSRSDFKKCQRGFYR